MENGQKPQDQPPWVDVDARAVAADLSRQLAGAQMEMAMMRSYIAQLHDALVALQAAVPQEETPAGVG